MFLYLEFSVILLQYLLAWLSFSSGQKIYRINPNSEPHRIFFLFAITGSLWIFLKSTASLLLIFEPIPGFHTLRISELFFVSSATVLLWFSLSYPPEIRPRGRPRLLSLNTKFRRLYFLETGGFFLILFTLFFPYPAGTQVPGYELNRFYFFLAVLFSRLSTRKNVRNLEKNPYRTGLRSLNRKLKSAVPGLAVLSAFTLFSGNYSLFVDVLWSFALLYLQITIEPILEGKESKNPFFSVDTVISRSPYGEEFLEKYLSWDGKPSEHIYNFINGLYSLQFFAVYHRDGSKSASDAVLIPDTFRSVESSEAPPVVLPDFFLEFILRDEGKNRFGALTGDLYLQADLRGREDVKKILAAFAVHGAEIVLPVHNFTSDGKFNDYYLIFSGRGRGVLPFSEQELRLLRNMLRPFSLVLFSPRQLRKPALQSIPEKPYEENPAFSPARSDAVFVFDQTGPMGTVMDQAERFSFRDSPLLITGETGTGKELVARMIHKMSGRSGAFIGVNISAIPQDLIENELFGHVKGAFTGAVETTDGLVMRARDGTLFLDEIGDLSLEGQVKLLRLIQDGVYERIGSSESIQANARFLFSTSRNLETETDAGRFRADLYYRISIFELMIPPLRERPGDLPLLTEHFLKTARQTFHRPGLVITEEAKKMICSWKWPGNIRELENVIPRASVMSENGILDTEDFKGLISDQGDLFKKKIELERMRHETERLEYTVITEALRECRGNQSAAAELIGMSRGALQHRMRKLGINGNRT